MKRVWVWVIAIVLIGLFWWLRFNNIRTSLFFFNDMGSDMLVLQDWVETKKPPLLGPQTSALPINQSAIYFYMLMPMFLLFNGNPVCLLYTNALLYIGSFIAGMWWLRKDKKMQSALLTVFFLIAISPQYVIQSRFVWNPSLVTPFLISSLVSLYWLNKEFKKLTMWIFAFSLAMAVSLTYSVAPVFIAIFVYILFSRKTNRTQIIIAELVSLIILNAPTLLFELKHKFLLTSMLFSRGASTQKAEDITAMSKFGSLFGFGFNLSGVLLVVASVLILGTIFGYSAHKKNDELRLFAKILGLTLLITFFVPLTIHAHYIFGFTSLLFLTIAFLPKLPRIIILIFLGVMYLTPTQVSSYFVPARRTMTEMTRCFAQVCKDINEPIFVSVQSDFHPYHNGPEHRYLLKRAGCQVKYIETDPKAASLMAVVLDDSSFVNGKTSFNELTSFGRAEEIQRYTCQSNFGVVILSNKVPAGK